MSATEQLRQLRRQIDLFLAQHPNSPLSPSQQLRFGGLRYYDFNPALIVVADVAPPADPQTPVLIATSTGDTVAYPRFGRVSFAVDSQTVGLTIFGERDNLFLPFRDATNGVETYGAGRYLDNHRPGLVWSADGRLQIDFNYCYNPYCAYSADYSCPLPPRENWLDVPIRAGELDFDAA